MTGPDCLITRQRQRHYGRVECVRLTYSVAIFARIRAERPARLFILGDGPAQPALRALTQRLGLQEDVWFAPFDKNPFKYMARCSVFALSSRYEGLSGVLIQANGFHEDANHGGVM